MKYWTAEAPGERNNLILESGDIPEAQEGELLVEVKAVGVNRLDINHREAMDKDGILGVEMSGRVVENKSNDKRFEKGTHVAGIVSSGAYAEYVTIPAGQAMVVPEELSFAEAAAIPEVFLTAYQTLFWLGDLKEGETVLIHAGGSGVGTAAVQLAKKLADAHVITTAGQEEKLDVTYSLGADLAVNYKEEDFTEHVLEETEDHGADVILDFIGASYYEKNMKSIAVDGRWVLISVLGGSEIENFDLMPMLGKRVSLIATLLSPRSDEYKEALRKEFEEKVMPFFASGEIKPVIYEELSFEDVPEAHRIMENDENIGKIMLTLD